MAPGTPGLLRAINERIVFESVREFGPVSRAQVARVTGLSKPTVSQALASLARRSLVRDGGRSSGGRGPTAALYEVDPHGGFVVAIDVGRSLLRLAIADLNGGIIAQMEERSHPRGAAGLVSQLGTSARGLARRVGVRWQRVTVVCVGTPGVLEAGEDHLRLAHNIPGWEERGVVRAIKASLGRPVVFENDVNLATIGEQRFGLGKGVQNFAYLHVGTGVGMGVVMNGELFRGSNGGAGEVGYLPIATMSGVEPGDRRRGALEAAIGAQGVKALARRAGFGSRVTMEGLFTSARRGDGRAVEVLRTIGARVALAVTAIVSVLDPELIVLGGVIGRNADLFLDVVETGMRSMSPFRPRVDVSMLGDDAELQGAVSRALEETEQKLFPRSRVANGRHG